jgi:hypothetical protein
MKRKEFGLKCSWLNKGTTLDFSGHADDNHETLSAWAVSGPRLEPSISIIQVSKGTGTFLIARDVVSQNGLTRRTEVLPE